MFEIVARVVNWVYGWSGDYAASIGFMAVLVMVILTPLTLKSTKGMLQMQRLQPELRRLQLEHRGDRQKLNEEMMRLYQSNRVNPLSSCLPLVAQMPVFIIMFQVLNGLTRLGSDGTFDPKYIHSDVPLYQSLDKTDEMLSFGLNLALTPAEAMGENFVKGLPYALLIVVLGGLFFVQQRMVASRTVSPTMSPAQAKLMQYLPVAFALFQVFLPTSLVAYYMVQAVFRILQQGYITRRFYGENGLGREAQEASAKAREIAKDAPAKKDKQKKEQQQAPAPIQSKRVTPGKNRPTPSGRPARPVPPSKRNK